MAAMGLSELLGSHKPSGPLRGGKYSAFDAGTRVPFLVRWPGHVKPGTSDALTSQLDLFASLASLAGQSLSDRAAPDSFNQLPVLLGQSDQDRAFVVEHAASGALSLIKDGWKLIEPHDGPKMNTNTNIELGHDLEPQLYNLENDLGERHNVAKEFPEKVEELLALLETIKSAEQTRM